MTIAQRQHYHIFQNTEQVYEASKWYVSVQYMPSLYRCLDIETNMEAANKVVSAYRADTIRFETNSDVSRRSLICHAPIERLYRLQRRDRLKSQNLTLVDVRIQSRFPH